MELVNENSSLKKQISNVWRLSVPAILTQISAIVMQYIDSSMVGKLGEDASASIGIVSTSTWVIGGVVSAVAIGFSVQVAHAFGAGKKKEGRNVLAHGLLCAISIALLLMVLALLISGPLPHWLGGNDKVVKDASLYFIAFAISIPFMMLNNLSSSVLQCSGNMVLPSSLNAAMCFLDIIFNAIFIPIYGVLGAGIGTALSVVVISIIMAISCCFLSKDLKLRKGDCYHFDVSILKKAFRIGSPIALEQIAMCGAMVVTTIIVSPLGNANISAHSFAITAESLCYMPAFGMSAAATTLVGQQIGAGNSKMAKRYSNISLVFGTSLMTLMAIIMFIFCPFVFKFLTPVEEVQKISTTILRIGLIAEPLYGVSIVANGGLRGTGDTFVPGILIIISIWVVRIGMQLLLVDKYGINGIWIAMASELSVRGILLLIRQQTSKYFYKKKDNVSEV